MLQKHLHRTITYYLYFAQKMNEGVNSVTALDIANTLHISQHSVHDDFSRIYKLSGRKSYGYHVKFMFNSFATMLQLTDTIHLLNIGPVYPFITANIKNYNVQLQSLEQPISPELCNLFDAVVLTRELEDTELDILDASPIRFILNFTGETYSPKSTHIENYTLMTLLCTANVCTFPQTKEKN